MKETSDRILTAIYCDDIRHEIGNKMSFMGCYQSELFVPTAPIGLAKLCVYLTILTPKARPFKSLTFRVVLDDQTELARLEIPPEGFADLQEVPDDTATRKAINTAMVFSPFIIEKASVLRVVADTEEGEISGPRLLIKVAPEVLSPIATTPAQVSSETAVRKSRRKKATKLKEATDNP